MFGTLKDILAVLIEIKQNQEVINDRLAKLTNCVSVHHGATGNKHSLTTSR